MAATFRHWVVIVAGGALAAALFVLNISDPEVTFPAWTWVGTLVGTVMVAQFLAFREMVRSRDSIEQRFTTAARRKEIYEALASFLARADSLANEVNVARQILAKEQLRGDSSASNASHAAERQVGAWQAEVEEYLRGTQELGPAYVHLFWLQDPAWLTAGKSRFPDQMELTLKVRQDKLKGFMEDFKYQQHLVTDK